MEVADSKAKAKLRIVLFILFRMRFIIVLLLLFAAKEYAPSLFKYASLFKIVLSFFLSLLSEFYGVMRAVVIAGEAGEAILVVQPFGIFAVTALDIAHGTNIGADATLHTLVFLHMESLVADEHVFEETAHYLGEEPWDRPLNQSAYAFLPIENFLANHG